MKKILLITTTIAALICSVSVLAFKLPFKKKPHQRIDYSSWIASQSFPSEENGIQIFYPRTADADSTTFFTGSLPVKGLTAEQVMLAAMVYATTNFNTEKQERFTAVSYPDKKFSIVLSSTQGSNNKETTYTGIVDITAEKGMLNFTVNNIKVRYRQKGLVPRTVDAETLHPDTDTRHAELVLEMSRVISDYLNRMAHYAAERTDICASHYDEMQACRVVNGMNPDEVIIAIGPARDTRHSGERTRWIYDNEHVIVFTNGKVTKAIE